MAAKKFLVDIDLNGNVIIDGDTTLGFVTPIAVTTLNLPAKTVGTYTLATLADIPTTIVGITGTKTEFDTAVTDSDFVWAEDNEPITGLWNFKNNGAGGFTDYDISIGDTDVSPTYGMARFGSATIGRTSRNTANLDLDGTVVIINNDTPATSNILFAMLDGSNSLRFALPKSAVGNATYNPRSMLLAGPVVNDDTVVTVGYWQGQGIFHNLACDTGTDGADLGVQNDLEVEGNIFIDSIKESTIDTGVTIDGLLIKDGGIPEAAVTTHETALSIAWSQITGEPTTFSGYGISDTMANLDSAISDGDVAYQDQTLVVGDHGTASVDQVVNVCYGTSSTPPTASGTTEGTLYIQYTA